jgi:hypothetical protein
MRIPFVFINYELVNLKKVVPLLHFIFKLLMYEGHKK